MSGPLHYLNPLFEPRSVCIVGATEMPGKVGQVLVGNMLAAGFAGPLYAVNPKYRAVQGVRCFASVQKLPQPVDLAVVAAPAKAVPRIIDDCGRAGIHAAVVITAGFGETGPEGAALEREVHAYARRHGVRILGPNCLGMLRPERRINASFSHGMARAGSLGLVSQSGAVCTAMLDWAWANHIGFSSVISLGGSTDVDFGEVIDYLASDSATQHILLYVEGVRDGRRFMSSLRAAARVKPVILMKVGRHPEGSRAAVSHTGAIVGMDDVFDAVVRRAGVVRVNRIDQLIAAAQALASRVRPRGERLAIVTNGGGPGVMAAERAADRGLPLAQLSAATLAALRDALPANWSHANPVDLIGDAGSERYRAALAACLADDGVDGVLTILTPQAMTDAESVADVVADSARKTTKPLVACWMGESSVAQARSRLQAAHVPVFRTPEPAVDVFAHLSAFYRNQQTLLMAPGPMANALPPDIAAAKSTVAAALAQGRTLLNEAERETLLRAFHLPAPQALFATTASAAVSAAGKIGFPVVLKIVSKDITHKTDVGGVLLGLADAEQVRSGYATLMDNVARAAPSARLDGVRVEPMIHRVHGRELMVGIVRDPVFGPALSVGMGGTLVEVHRDRSVELPPLNGALCDAMVARSRASRMLGAFRGMPAVSRDALNAVLMCVSEIACELPEIEEFEINPVVVDDAGAVAIDSRVVVRSRPAQARRYAHLAIHPYPVDLVVPLRLPDGSELVMRPIRPEDAAMECEFVRNLSAETRHLRFMGAVRELTPTMLARFTQIDYDREMALIAVQQDTQLAVARYVTLPDGRGCEFAIAVADAWQGRGLGRRLLGALMRIAREHGLERMEGEVLASNHRMLAFCESLGFAIEPASEEGQKRVVADLQTAPRLTEEA